MTDGFEVLVQLVMAAITTEPWPTLVLSTGESAASTGGVERSTVSDDAGRPSSCSSFGLPPGLRAWAGSGSLAGNVSATAAVAAASRLPVPSSWPS
jgi:hypothetical protein